MPTRRLFDRYRELQGYVGWDDENARTIESLQPLVEPHFPQLVEDFYDEIQRHPDALKVITGGEPQIERLKQTLIGWLQDLFSGRYDEDYVGRRWKIGYRHVEIGLDQVYTNVALSRLRRGLLAAIEESATNSTPDLLHARSVLNTLLDLDLALIEDAYQTEHTNRQQSMERLATVGKVAGGVAHELRNPLNVIKTSVFYLLNARNPNPEKTAKHLNRIERQVGVADDVIVSLSSFARMPFPNQQPFAVGPFLREVLDEHEIADGIDASIECPDHVPMILADRGQMKIVFSNLIRNACDAMPDGGRLILSAEDEGECVGVCVSDTGHGIEAEHLARVMEPFFSTKSRGIGLGLALAKALVEKNDGRLSVESEIRQGTTFTVLLNLVRKPD